MMLEKGTLLKLKRYKDENYHCAIVTESRPVVCPDGNIESFVAKVVVTTNPAEVYVCGYDNDGNDPEATPWWCVDSSVSHIEPIKRECDDARTEQEIQPCT